jgi:hypothetical protein
MKANIYISLKATMNENISISTMIYQDEIGDKYSNHLDFSKKMGSDRTESLQGFKLSYLYLENVTFDGRKKKTMVTDDDIYKALEKQGYAVFTGTTSIFGGYYRPTEKLINQLNEQLETRKQLINEGSFINPTEAVQETIEEVLSPEVIEEEEVTTIDGIQKETAKMTKLELRNQLNELKRKLNESPLLTEVVELAKQIQITCEEIMKVPEPKLLETFTRGKYKIELFYKVNDQDMEWWHPVYTNIETGKKDEELSDVLYSNYNAALKDMKSIEEIKQVKETKQPKQTKKVSEVISKIDMIADYAQIIYSGNKAVITFTNSNTSNSINFEYKRSWSHRKYIDKALELTGIKPSWEFRYGWEFIAV